MPFKEETKNPTMTTKNMVPGKTQVVSTQSGNEGQIAEEIAALPNAGEREVHEAGSPVDFSILEDEVPASAQAQKGVNPAEFVGFADPSVHINQMKPEDLNNFMRASVIARPLRLPARLDVRSKDPNYRLRWVECKAEDGRRYSDMLAAGFVNAGRKDVVGLNSAIKVSADDVIKADDLILMKIPCEIIDGYLKHNALQALKMISRQGSTKMAQAEGNKTLRQGIADSGLNPNSQYMKDAFGNNKLEIYSPNS